MDIMTTYDTFHPTPYGDESCWSESLGVQSHDDQYVNDEWSLMFPGPLLSAKMEKEDLMVFIQEKSQEILLRVEEPEQKEAYFFWQVMELMCKRNGKTLMAEIAVRLFKGYSCLRSKAPKLVCGESQDDWCLRLAELLCSAAPDEELRQAVLEMADDLGHKGQILASHICCVVAQLELGSYTDSSFDLIGCYSLPSEEAAIREAIERSEVYEYVLFLTSGIAQLNFQKYKAIRASMLAKEGLCALALYYYESIARAVATSPSSIKLDLLKEIILKSEKLLQWMPEDPEWLLSLRRLCEDRVEEDNGIVHNPEDRVAEPAPVQMNTTPEEEVILSRFVVGELLGEGSFGSVYAGVRKADGKLVAIKLMSKWENGVNITIPGEKDGLPLEVALLQMVSVPPRCDYVVELLEWFETSSSYILVLERPSPCVDLFTYWDNNSGRLPEPVARVIMWQVVQATRHCFERRVLHRDIKPENFLINTETMQVKMIDFGCGLLLKDSPYTVFAGTPLFWPPEWFRQGHCMGCPATIWSLGVLLFFLVCGGYPFQDKDEIAHADILQNPSLLTVHAECRDLILRCLDKDPSSRATLDDMINHKWLTGELYAQTPPGTNTRLKTCIIQAN